MSDSITIRSRSSLPSGEPLPGRPRDARLSPAQAPGDADGWEYAQPSRTARPADPLLSVLDGALREFEQTLETFSWPAILPPLRDGRSDPVLEPTVGRLPPRLEAALEEIFRGPPPRVLAEAMAVLARDAEDVVMAYNRLRTLSSMNARRLRPEFAEGWRPPLVRLTEELSWLGLEEVGQEGVLWARRREFLTGVARLPERAFDVLAGSSGLVYAWRQIAAQVRRQGLTRFLAQDPTARRPVSEPDDAILRPRGLLDLSS